VAKVPKKPTMHKAQAIARTTGARVSGVKVMVTTAGLSREAPYGRLVVRAAALTKAAEKKNIAEGRSALKRAKAALVRPGVQVKIKDGVPMYHADPNKPGFLVRTLNGETARGRLVGGKFRPA